MFSFLSKGKFEILLDDHNVAQGQPVTGTLRLTLKKPIEATELVIRLRARREVTREDHDGNRVTETETVFDFSQPLDGPKLYDSSAGPLEYRFSINTPGDTAAASVDFGGGALGRLAGVAAQMAGMGAAPKWHVMARLDVKGLDLREEVQVNVS